MREQGPEAEAQNRKQHEGRGKDDDVKAPLGETVDHRLPRQARALHEEHDGNRERGERAEEHGPFPVTGQKGGDGDGRDDREREAVREEFSEALHSPS